MLRKAVAKTGERFSTKGDICGDSFSYVGLAVMRDRPAHQIYVNQTGYLRKVLGKFEMLTCCGRATPMDASVKLRAHTEAEDAADRDQYRQAI